MVAADNRMMFRFILFSTQVTSSLLGKPSFLLIALGSQGALDQLSGNYTYFVGD